MNKSKFKLFLAVLLLAGFFNSACDTQLGLGPPVDLEAPTIRVSRIELADGTVIPIYEEDNKLFVGPGILVGSGAVLYGEARDNESVVEVFIEEIGDNAEIIDGVRPNWSTPVSSSKNSSGWQQWSIGLEGLQRGERVITISAFDNMTVNERASGRLGNIGPESVQQLTLLVDTNPPIVELIQIERSPGLFVGLLPRQTLMSFDSSKFDNINYFQNESFIIRASISHDFSLSNVKINFLDETGNTVFLLDQERTGGTVYTPFWLFTHDQLVAANPNYESGRHYLNVVITATATAGHSGKNLHIDNTFYSFCWYPESDFPRIQTQPPDIATGSILVEKGAIIPITVFDDDNLGEVYAGIVSEDRWLQVPGATDEDKLEYLKNNYLYFLDELNEPFLQSNRLNAPIARTVISLNVTKNRGQYRLVVLVKDSKTGIGGNPANTPVWNKEFRNVSVMEEGVPIITIDEPEENTSPPLTNNAFFKVKGSVVNLDPVEFIKIAWAPAGMNLAPGPLMSTAQNVLTSGSSSHPSGIRVWTITNPHGTSFPIGDKLFVRQDFEFTFDVFNDFLFHGELENEVKTFVLYTRSRGEEPEDVFEQLRLMPYKQPPTIDVLSPANWREFAPNDLIEFIIHPVSESGLPITEVTLYSSSKGDYLQLTESTMLHQGNQIKVWTAQDSHTNVEQYRYTITAKDKLGNENLADRFIRVDSLPNLVNITTPHVGGTVFSSRDTVRIQAVFERAVSAVDTAQGIPRIRLTGFTHNEPRYATYTSGAESNVLIFTYAVQSGDDTGTGVLRAERLENIAGVSAIIPSGNLSSTITDPLTQRGLDIKGVSPRITNIRIERAAGKENYNNQNFSWHREGEEISFYLTMDKPVRVLGNPRLVLPFNGGATGSGFAVFQTTEALSGESDRIMRFTYRVRNNDLYDTANLTINVSQAFTDLTIITDKVGAQGNYLSLAGTPGQTTNVRVDSVRPPAPIVQISPDDFTAPGNHPSGSRSYRVLDTGIESHAGTIIQYTLSGSQWLDIARAALPFTAYVSDPSTYNIQARQIDRAGNISDPSPVKTIILSSSSELISIISTSVDRSYNFGSTLDFKLIFSGAVTSTGAGSVTLAGGTGTVTTPVVINLPVVAAANADFALEFSWSPPEGRHMNPVQISAINLTGVRRATGNASLFTDDANNASKVEAVRAAYNRSGIEVLTIRPNIISGTPVASSRPAAGLTGNTLTLTFSTEVWPESGYIRVRPTATGNNGDGLTTDGLWLIPPVLEVEDFTRIRNALPSSQRNTLFNFDTNTGLYQRTTHGLVSGDRWVPDTDTKFVLGFERGVNDPDVRALLDTAKYLWQEIEVVSDRVQGGGTNTITVTLDPLVPGRQWKVEIIGNETFHDRAYNYFSGWQENTNTFWFWSARTATPVVRVERVTNNRASVAQAAVADAILRTNVRYRIDTVTPGARIAFNTWNRGTPAGDTIDALRGINGGVARVIATMPSGSGPFNANSSPADTDHVNSNILDASNTEMTVTLSNSIADINANLNNANYTIGTFILGGTTTQTTNANDLYVAQDLYNARKDYIGARAKRSNLAISDTGYEGIFKTVVVYRNVGNVIQEGRFLRTEGTNLRNGAVTIAGFPMVNNDMSGRGSRFVYRNSATATDRAADHIFISWEIVSNFWHVAMTTSDGNPFSSFTAAHDPWAAFSQDWYNHNFRKYGNWGLRVGN